MNHLMYFFTGFLIVFVIICVFFIFFRKKIIRKPLNKRTITKKWKNLMKHLVEKDKWAQAILDADSLVDEVLKKKRYGGKTMGERLVSAQKDLKKNDGIWFAHKFSNNLSASKSASLDKNDVVKVLNNYKDALVDLDALTPSKGNKK